MNDLRETLRRLIDGDDASAAPVVIGAVVTVVWLVMVVLFWVFGGSGEGSGTAQLARIVGVLLPLLLIWLAVGYARAIDALRAEASDLRAELARMQGRRVPDDADVGPVVRPSAHSPRPAETPRASAAQRPAAAPPADNRQTSMGFDEPAPEPVSIDDLVRALNFPDGPDDHEAIAALRSALADPDAKRLIRSAQDVVTLLAQSELFMDHLPPIGDGATWRRYADGVRGRGVAELATPASDDALDAAVQAMHGDEIFRDTAHHFLRQFDRALARRAGDMDDATLEYMVHSRSGRAFTLLAQATGMFGEGA